MCYAESYTSTLNIKLAQHLLLCNIMLADQTPRSTHVVHFKALFTELDQYFSLFFLLMPKRQKIYHGKIYTSFWNPFLI